MKIKAFTFVNNCFQDEHNAIIGVFLEILTMFNMSVHFQLLLDTYFLFSVRISNNFFFALANCERDVDDEIPVISAISSWS